MGAEVTVGINKNSSNNNKNLFMFPLVLIHMCASNTDMYACKNNVPGFFRFCQLIKFVYEKESLLRIKTKIDRTLEQYLLFHRPM